MSATRRLPIIFAMTAEAVQISLPLLIAGDAAAVVFFDDGPHGAIIVRTMFARGQEHRAKEIDELLANAVERGAFARVDPALLTKRGEA